MTDEETPVAESSKAPIQRKKASKPLALASKKKEEEEDKTKALTTTTKPRKQRKWHPGTVSARVRKEQQNSIKSNVPCKTFTRYMRRNIESLGITDVKISKSARNYAKDVYESLLINMLRYLAYLSDTQGKVTTSGETVEQMKLLKSL